MALSAGCGCVIRISILAAYYDISKEAGYEIVIFALVMVFYCVALQCSIFQSTEQSKWPAEHGIQSSRKVRRGIWRRRRRKWWWCFCP